MSVSTTNRLITALALTVGLCTAPGCATVPKRPAQPELVAPPCPAGSAQTFAAMGMELNTVSSARLEAARTDELGGWLPAPVTPGLVYMVLYRESWGGLPMGTRFKGEVHIQKDRVYLWFTEALAPGKDPVPVCMEVADGNGIDGSEDYFGTEIYGPGPRGSVLIPSSTWIVVTDKFHTHP